jgi:hypothetical protein
LLCSEKLLVCVSVYKSGAKEGKAAKKIAAVKKKKSQKESGLLNRLKIEKKR